MPGQIVLEWLNGKLLLGAYEHFAIVPLLHFIEQEIS